MCKGKCIPSVLYTKERAEASQKTQEELNVPDPQPEQANASINKNIVTESKELKDPKELGVANGKSDQNQ